ncbi:MAG: MFS transporter [Lentisphaeria bacterium]|nr:MFS transporter [Lentisphaeria bacterium]
MMNNRNKAVFQLTTLTLIHFAVDMLGGVIPGILPVLLKEYGFSIAAGSFLVTAYIFTGNAVQVPAGLTRKKSTKPLLIQIGLLMSGIILFAGFIPKSGSPYLWLVICSFLVGIGGAIAHPESLRCVCAIDDREIPPAVATSVFVTAGFFGYNCGPLFAGILVEKWGLPGLNFIWLLIIPLIYMLVKSQVRMADGTGSSKGKSGLIEGKYHFTFWQLFWCSACINTACSIVQGLLPTYLRDCGFSLTFAGFSALLFGIGAGLGALYTGSVLMKRFVAINCIGTELVFGVPMLLCYLLLAPLGAWAAVLNFIAGSLIGAGFPQLVVLARTAPNGPPLGVRMGLIVGGTWSFAGIALWFSGILADHLSLRAALLTAPGYLAMTLVLFWLFSRKR